jgi:GMP synthase (glutamine-hydrolysing)
MKKLYILKTGTTYPATAKRLGDFDTWSINGLGNRAFECRVLDVEHGSELPDAGDCAGVLITGSHSMVTENLPWSLRVERWIAPLLASRIPILGICYGHQLLARAAGGQVGFHPTGKEIGTVQIQVLPDGTEDGLFRNMPSSFRAHVCHAQTVLSLPPNAVRLAWNQHEPNHAFRIGGCAWGVQFHPEYTVDIMKAYIEEQAEELQRAGMDPADLSATVQDTPLAAVTLENFARVVECA